MLFNILEMNVCRNDICKLVKQKKKHILSFIMIENCISCNVYPDKIEATIY